MLYGDDSGQLIIDGERHQLDVDLRHGRRIRTEVLRQGLWVWQAAGVEITLDGLAKFDLAGPLMGEGEKFVTSTVIFAGKVIAASFAPTPGADPCAARGDATAYIFDLLTGEGYFRDNSNNAVRTLDIGVGLPTDPKVSVGPGGKDNRAYIEKSGADLESIGQEDVPAGGRLLYWREVP